MFSIPPIVVRPSTIGSTFVMELIVKMLTRVPRSDALVTVHNTTGGRMITRMGDNHNLIRPQLRLVVATNGERAIAMQWH